jgi:hypothetical protein
MSSMSLLVKDLLYLQDSIKATFQDGSPLINLITGLKDGSVLPTDLPAMRVLEVHDGGGIPDYYCLDHRRLYCLKEASLPGAAIPVIVYNFNRLIDEMAKGENLDFMVEVFQKFTTKSPETIRLRSGPPEVKVLDELVTKIRERLFEEERRIQEQRVEAEEVKLTEEIATLAVEDIHLEYLKEVLRIRLENGESGVLEDNGGENDTVECIESTLQCLDMVKELSMQLDSALVDKQEELIRVKRQLSEAEAKYEARQRRNAENKRALEASRAQLESSRAIAREQIYSSARPFYQDWGYSYGSPSNYCPMIQTHDGCLFPVGTSTSSIRNCLMSLGTFERGHGPISDCPIVNASDL